MGIDGGIMHLHSKKEKPRVYVYIELYVIFRCLKLLHTKYSEVKEEEEL